MTLRSMMRTPRPDGSAPKNPVRAGSLPASGEWERAWHCTRTKGELVKMRRIADVHRRRLYATRRSLASPAERARIPVPSKNGLDILAALASRAVNLLGRQMRLLIMSYRELANRAGCSVETVRRQIALLKRAGLLRWQRRCRRTEAKAEFGAPQWEQAENIYELVTPLGVKREHARAAAEVDRRQAQAVAQTASDQRASTAPAAVVPRQPPPPPAPFQPEGQLFRSQVLMRRAALLQHETHKLTERPDLQAFEEEESGVRLPPDNS